MNEIFFIFFHTKNFYFWKSQRNFFSFIISFPHLLATKKKCFTKKYNIFLIDKKTKQKIRIYS